LNKTQSEGLADMEELSQSLVTGMYVYHFWLNWSDYCNDINTKLGITSAFIVYFAVDFFLGGDFPPFVLLVRISFRGWNCGC
jgi:hypothetical protein